MSETQPQLTGKMFLFKEPELLSVEQHGSIGFNPPEERFGFCKKIRGFPINANEVAPAMKHYPVFVVNYDMPMLLAATGVIDDENLFVDEKGAWEPKTYVPAYVRRYPFGIASDSDSDRFAIVIDRAFDGLGEGGEIPLFENGEPSENTKKAIDFCQGYERDRFMTKQFCEKLKELELLEGQKANFTAEGSSEEHSFAEYIGVSEQAVKKLTGDQLAELRDNGMLPIVYAMLMSLGNWPLLLQRRAERHKLNGVDVLNPIS